MSYQNKPGTGAIFKNDKKEKETHPDYRGTINIEGQDFEIALWVKDGKKGKFFSASVKMKEGADTIATHKGHVKANTDDLPF